ncbi:MAG: hypothetical protein M0P44_06610 [Clostridiales bacterium]|nr:hypothetical protein [Clostridiales bacterium]
MRRREPTDPTQKQGGTMQNVLAGLFLVGIVIAGSDGDWFPWVNLGGLALSGVAVWVVGRIYEEAS